MKFAYSTSVFRFRPLSEAIDGIARAGFCAVEIIADRPHAFPEDLTAAQITTLNQCLHERKIRVCNLDSVVVTALGESPGPSWIEEDWQEREKRIRYTLDCLRMAAAMGVSRVSTGVDRIPDTTNHLNAMRLMVANLQRVLPLAKKLGLKLLIQPRPDSLLHSSDNLLELINEVGPHEHLKINFDVGHLFVAGEDPVESWKRLKSHVDHVNLEDMAAGRAHRHIQLGEGAIDIPGFIECLKESDYTGYVAIKLDSHDQRGDEIALASARYLKDKGFMPAGCEGRS